MNEAKHLWESIYESFDMNLIPQVQSVFEGNEEGARNAASEMSRTCRKKR